MRKSYRQEAVRYLGTSHDVVMLNAVVEARHQDLGEAS